MLSEARLWPISAASAPLPPVPVIALATIAEVATTEEATSRPKRLPVSVAAAAIARRTCAWIAAFMAATAVTSDCPHWGQKRTAGP